MTRMTLKPLAFLPLIATLTACQVPVVLQGDQAFSSATSSSSGSNSATDLEMSQTESLAAVKDVLDAKADQIPTLSAVGYAVISSQPGRSDAQKRLMAIRAARKARGAAPPPRKALAPALATPLRGARAGSAAGRA